MSDSIPEIPEELQGLKKKMILEDNDDGTMTLEMHFGEHCGTIIIDSSFDEFVQAMMPEMSNMSEEFVSDTNAKMTIIPNEVPDMTVIPDLEDGVA